MNRYFFQKPPCTFLALIYSKELSCKKWRKSLEPFSRKTGNCNAGNLRAQRQYVELTERESMKLENPSTSPWSCETYTHVMVSRRGTMILLTDLLTDFGVMKKLRPVLGVMKFLEQFWGLWIFLDQFWGSLMVIYANHG